MENRINRQMDLKVEVAYEEGNPYVNLSGEMDVYTSPRVKQAALNLIAEGKHHLIFEGGLYRYRWPGSAGRYSKKSQRSWRQCRALLF